MNDFSKDLVNFIRSQYNSKDFIPLHAPRFEGNEKKYLIDTIESTFVSTIGSYVNKFEDMICNFTGAKYAIATVNGTSALHAALLVAGVKPQCEVITQSLTFVATCNAIRYCGAEPVFVDIEQNTLGMSPESLNEFLELYAEIRDDGFCWNKKTNQIIKACVPMHNFGHPVRIDEIKDLCNKFNIILIEDAAESLGSQYKKVHTGRFGLLGVFSFNGNKIITSGGGGIIITDDEAIARKAKHLTTTAKKMHPWLFIHDEVGFNYRMPNLNAALGCAQMEVLDDYINRKRLLAEKYSDWFCNTDNLFILEPKESRSNYWINAFLAKNLEERNQILKYTNSNNVMTRPSWTPMHLLDIYKNNLKMDLKITESIESRLVNIPSSVIL